MIHVVAYDITNDKRLARVAKICEDYGVRMEKSVFEMDLPTAVFAEFWQKLERTVDTDVDSVVDYPVTSHAQVVTIGQAVRPEPGCLVF